MYFIVKFIYIIKFLFTISKSKKYIIYYTIVYFSYNIYFYYSIVFSIYSTVYNNFIFNFFK